MLVIIAYIVYTITALFIAAVLGTFISAMKGKASSHFSSPGFVLVTWLIFGLPCYFAGDYLLTHGNESFTFLILGIVFPVGIMLGLSNKA